MKKSQLIKIVKESIQTVTEQAYGHTTLTSQGQSISGAPGVWELEDPEDDRPPNWRELPGYNPDAFYPIKKTAETSKTHVLILGDKKEVTIQTTPGKDLSDVTISWDEPWGKEEHTVDFEYEDTHDDHGNEGMDATFTAESDISGKGWVWVFMVDVYLEASYHQSGNIGDWDWDTLEIDKLESKDDNDDRPPNWRELPGYNPDAFYPIGEDELDEQAPPGPPPPEGGEGGEGGAAKGTGQAAKKAPKAPKPKKHKYDPADLQKQQAELLQMQYENMKVDIYNAKQTIRFTNKTKSTAPPEQQSQMSKQIVGQKKQVKQLNKSLKQLKKQISDMKKKKPSAGAQKEGFVKTSAKSLLNQYETERGNSNLKEHVRSHKKQARRQMLMEGAMKKFFEYFDQGKTNEEIVQLYAQKGVSVPEQFVGKARSQYEGLKKLKLELETSEQNFKDVSKMMVNNATEEFGDLGSEKQLASGLTK